MIPISNLEDLQIFDWKGFSLPKVSYKKLGKINAWGQYHSNNTIDIDPRLKGKKEFEIYIHELSHGLFPEFSEEKVIQVSRIITDFLWELNYRKVDNNKE